MTQSFYEKSGGFAAVSRIVLALYDRILDDDDLGPFFDDVDMKRLVDHQTKFVTYLMGGPASFTDEQIAAVHRRLEIDDSHFNRLLELVRETLEDFGLSAEDVDALAAGFEARRALLVG